MEIRLDSSTFGKFNINPKALFLNFLNFDWGSALTETVGHERTKEMLAFQLLFKSMQATNLELSKKYWQEELDKAKNVPIQADKLEMAITQFFEEEVLLTADFFKNVIHYDQSFLRKSLELFKEFISIFVEKPVFTDDFTWEYYKNYKSNIANEFILQDYSILVDYFNNPVKEQNDDESILLEHYKRTRDLFSSPFDLPNTKGESLKELYVKPHFSFFWLNLKNKPEDRDRKFVAPSSVMDVHEYIESYFFQGVQHADCKENYNMLFILGQPGQGKTSLCCKIVYDYLEKSNLLPNKPIFFIKIRDLDATDLVRNTFDTLRSHLHLDIDFERDSCVLILDGLDEAYMSGGIKDRDLTILFSRLSKCAFNNSNLKIILTSRFHYLKLDDSCLDKSLVIQLDEFSDHKILEYADKFKFFYPKNDFIAKIPNILQDDNFDHLGELIRQPVLIYFIAVADIKIEEDASKAIIYDKIFNRLAERSWDQSGQLDYILPSIREDKYSKYLRMFIRSIAFEIHQSPDLYIKTSKIGDLNSTQQFIQNCFSSGLAETNIHEISKYLLISFYFQESNNHSGADTAVEFFHNSLWEFLTAEYIWEEIKKDLLKKNIFDDVEYITHLELFGLFNKLIGNKEISNSISENLELLIQNDSEDVKNVVLDQLYNSFKMLQDKGFLLEYDYSKNKLSAIQKLSSITRLIWLVIHRTNIDKKKRLIVNSDLSRFLVFERYIIDEEFHNVDFLSGALRVDHLIEVSFKNCSFNTSTFDGIHDCHFDNVTFYQLGKGDCSYVTNSFKNVSFNNCYFGEASNWYENEMNGVKFINVFVKTKNWLLDLKRNNYIDDESIKKHHIERTNKNDDVLFRRFKYVIRYSEEVELS